MFNANRLVPSVLCIASSSHHHRIASSVLPQLSSEIPHATYCWLDAVNLLQKMRTESRFTNRSSATWRCYVGLVVPDVSKQPTLFIFKDQEVCVSFPYFGKHQFNPQCAGMKSFLVSEFSWFFRHSCSVLLHSTSDTADISKLTLRTDTCWITTIFIILTTAMYVTCHGLHNFFSQPSESVCLCQLYQTRGPPDYFIRPFHSYYASYRMWPGSMSKNWISSRALGLESFAVPAWQHTEYVCRETRMH